MEKMWKNRIKSVNCDKLCVHTKLGNSARTRNYGLIDENLNIEDSTTHHSINVSIEKLKKMLNDSCHQDISVLFIDYHMPEITGIDFLREIRHLPIKKALITGEQDYKVAIDAFNSGLVDAYVRKDDPMFPDKIQNIVSEL